MIVGGPVVPRRFIRGDGATVEVMQWNADSKPAVARWLRRHDVDFQVVEDPDEGFHDWDTRVLVIGTLRVREDDLLVRERREDGNRWSVVDRETWAAEYQEMPR